MRRRKLLVAGVCCGFGSLSAGCTELADKAPAGGMGSCTPPAKEFAGEDRQYREETYSDLRLELGKQVFEPGETLGVSLRNEGESLIRTKGRDRFDIQAKNGSNWESILCASGADSGEVHLDPGASFEWELELSTAKLVADAPELTVNVDEIRPGTYRFVYCGLTPAKLAEDDSGFWTLVWQQFAVTSSG